MAVGTVRVEGLPQLQRALKAIGSDLNKQIDRELKDAAEIVAADARGRFQLSPVGGSAASAAGFRPRIRGFGRVVVQQGKSRRTGRRGDYGAMQMRLALIPALGSKQGEVIDRLDSMLDRLAASNGF